MERDFKGVWISKEIWLSKDLTLQEKVFLVEICSLDNNEGCFASNGYFAEFFGISKTRVSLVIKSLVDKKYITSTMIYKEGSKQILKRVLKESYRGYITKVKDPPLGKLKDNNIVNNIVNKETIMRLSKEFEIFWKLYDKKVCKKDCLKKWIKLDDKTREDIMEFVPKYVKAKERKYRRDPIRFFSKEVWKDEIYDENIGQNGKGFEKPQGKVIIGTDRYGKLIYE